MRIYPRSQELAAFCTGNKVIRLYAFDPSREALILLGIRIYLLILS
uniref:Uncharacterized protein n=1 Tax=Arundo donax TaxID=35708 RepID=A0A0A9BFR8_ARUDO